MILAIDTGNTHTVIGCISSEGEILQIMRIETNPHKTEHEYAAGMKLILEMGGIDLKNVEGAVISFDPSTRRATAIAPFRYREPLPAPSTEH